MMARKVVWAPVAVGVGLLVLGACGKPHASPTPVPVPSITPSPTKVSVPANASISVRPAPTTVTTTVAATTEPPPPPQAQQPPVQVQPEPTWVEPTHQPVHEVALLGFPCDAEGETAVDPAGRPLVCEKSRRGKLYWARP
ncbi:hypothetical protein [Saccharothrix sp.]|uniref:hypothetical protein n=1 Tax=Saccharothrix sp. TaxID=1873460 RepID=UPI002810B7C7|nr:hypothetical protein [Saccharothrix sp.]